MHSTDASASRREFVAEINEMLGGSYNEAGIEQWWKRPRTALAGRTPLAEIGDNEELDPHAAERVRRLAAALVGPGNIA